MLLVVVIVTTITTVIIVVRYERLSRLPFEIPLRWQKGTKPKDRENVLENEQLRQITNNWFSTADKAENYMAEKDNNIRINITCLTESQG